jgi:superfamily II DNA/RNA helicase
MLPFSITLLQLRVSSLKLIFLFAPSLHVISRPQSFQRAHKSQDGQGACGIVYTHKRADATDIAKHLSDHGVDAEAYHAGLPAKKRAEVQEKWTSGEIPVICATIAFGMGIDKGDVRFVIHWTMPKSMESFYQESGRAGRCENCKTTLPHCFWLRSAQIVCVPSEPNATALFIFISRFHSPLRDGENSTSIVYYSKRDLEVFEFIISQEEKRQEESAFAKDLEKRKQAAAETKTNPKAKINPLHSLQPSLKSGFKPSSSSTTTSSYVPPRNLAFTGGKPVRSTDRRAVSSSSSAPRSTVAKKEKNATGGPKREQLFIVKKYCEEFGCRRKVVLTHFGESLTPQNHCKKGCDHCKGGNDLKQVLYKLQDLHSRKRSGMGGSVNSIVNRSKLKEGYVPSSLPFLIPLLLSSLVVLLFLLPPCPSLFFFPCLPFRSLIFLPSGTTRAWKTKTLDLEVMVAMVPRKIITTKPASFQRAPSSEKNVRMPGKASF